MQVQAQDVRLNFQVVQGAKDTVLVYGQSTTTSPVQINALTSSLLYDQGAMYEGFQSMIGTAWGTTGENFQAEQAISKTYAGNTYEKGWNYGIAALGQTGFSLPGSNDPARLVLKVWFF